MHKIYKVERKRCGFRGCIRVGEFQPELIFKNLKATSGKPLTVVLGVEVCEAHRRQPMRAFLSDEGYYHILKMLRRNGYHETPPLSEVSIQFVTESGLVIAWQDPRKVS